jgi:tetratricopeptide (TPR) repeat protein
VNTEAPKPTPPPGGSGATAAGRYEEALRLYGRGDFRAALELLGGIADTGDPLGRMARFYRAMCHKELGVEALGKRDFARAGEELHAAVALVGRTDGLGGYLASLYAASGRLDLCRDETQLALDRDTDNPSAWLKCALAQWRSGRRAEAFMTVTRAVRKLGDMCDLHVQLGLFHAAEDRLVEARSCLQRAVEADGTSIQAHHNLALVAAAQGDVPAALAAFQRAYDRSGGDLVIAWQLSLAARAAREAGHDATVRLQARPPRPAATQMRQLAGYVSREPDYIEAFCDLPPTGRDGELFAVIADVLDVAIGEHPAYADLHCLRSRTLARLGQLPAATEACERALEINPSYVKALIHVADLYAGAGRTGLAVEALEKAVARGGDWVDVNRRLAELRIGRRDRLGDAPVRAKAA